MDEKVNGRAVNSLRLDYNRTNLLGGACAGR